MTKQRHSFSIVIASKDHINRVSINNEPEDEVMFEGELGELLEIRLIEGILLQITGENGVLRVDLTEMELVPCLSKKR
ncbi:hypothetical protein E4H04_10930 [Candidatus Bathyarchaeota archaeon]|nr:hypothetical protein [Candidatus Bathyarchaeota archaeon]TFH14053.1 MAG: hypothetical protein E4H04_10930 [Candidatus Bathyarchaeota archaeon]